MSVTALIQRSPRFGIWAPVRGTFAALNHPDEPLDASWVRNRDAVLAAEQLGFDTVLVAEHTINPLDDEFGQLEAWSATAALAALTERLELIVAVKPVLFHPAVLAKMALQIEEISKGRLAINVVNAWFKPELERTGIGFGEHDERYAYGREWLSIVRRLLAGERVTHTGPRWHISDLQLRPAALHRERPRIYIGGESDTAQELVVDLGDDWLVNGQPVADIVALRDSMERRVDQKDGGLQPGFGMAAFVIARASQAQADAELALQWELDEASVRQKMLENTDRTAQMFQSFDHTKRIGTNGGTAAGLVGDYDTVAERIAEFHAAGIQTFLLQFQPLVSEAERFASEVIPRVRRMVTAR